MPKFELKDMEPVDIERLTKDKDGKFNPFHDDLYCMGRQISEDIYMMFDFHDTAPFRYCYLVNVKTGNRQQLVLNEKRIVKEPMKDKLKKYKESSGKTWKQIAKEIGCSEVYLWKMAAGKRTPSTMFNKRVEDITKKEDKRGYSRKS